MKRSKPRLSLIIIAFDMARELPRTIQSLSPDHQRGVTVDDYELVLVDNGSPESVPFEQLSRWGARIREAAPPRRSASPAGAINAGLEAAEADVIGVMIDGARLASPGLVAGALEATTIHPKPVVGTLGFHLGPDVQMKTVSAGYDAATEDRLLDDIDWPSDGYRLFQISSLAGSSKGGWFMPISESNALFTTSETWDELGGFDERFESPGGGLVNLDTWRRACDLQGSQPVILLGEGTFHQVHGGVATNSTTPPGRKFRREYEQIRGEPFTPPDKEPLFVGRIPHEAMPWILRSAQLANEAR